MNEERSPASKPKATGVRKVIKITGIVVGSALSRRCDLVL